MFKLWNIFRKHFYWKCVKNLSNCFLWHISDTFIFKLWNISGNICIKNVLENYQIAFYHPFLTLYIWPWNILAYIIVSEMWHYGLPDSFLTLSGLPALLFSALLISLNPVQDQLYIIRILLLHHIPLAHGYYWPRGSVGVLNILNPDCNTFWWSMSVLKCCSHDSRYLGLDSFKGMGTN